MIDIKSEFIKLTSKRYPHGKESQVIDLVKEYTFEKDKYDNYFIIIKKSDGTFSDTMFTCHIDTVDRSKFTTTDWGNRKWNTDTSKWDIIDPTKEVSGTDNGSVVHVISDDFIKTDGNSNLGADDKAGMVILLNMISENKPGLYYFFQGEESGCIGSSSLSRGFSEFVTSQGLPSIKRCIAFDRRGYDSVITHQMSSRCCSDEFGNEIAKLLNEYGFWYKNDSGGIYTDSAEFTDLIPECTNISVGYFSEHSLDEKQDIEFLELLSLATLKIDWDSLPITRTTADCVYKGKKSTTTRYSVWDDWGDEDNYYSRYNRGTFTSHANSSTVSNVTKPESTVLPDSTRKLVDDFDFDTWYNEQKIKNLVNPT